MLHSKTQQLTKVSSNATSTSH